MNKKFFMYAAAFAALSGTMVSCSEDDTTGGSSLFDSKPLTVTLLANGDDSNAAKPQRVHSTAADKVLTNYWSSDDVIFAYSMTENTLNKLTSADGTDNANRKQFTCSAATYEENERMPILYVGTQSLTIDTSHKFTLTKSTNPNDMAIVYGKGDKHYSDRKCPYVLKRSSSVAAGGKLSGTTEELTLKDAFARLRISLPAKDAADAAKLAQLKYVITVNLGFKNGTEVRSGYPNSVQFTIDGSKMEDIESETDSYKILGSTTKKYIPTMGEALTLTFDPEATDETAKPDVLWNTTEGASDYCKGYIYVPIPCGNYNKISVSVEVSNPNNVEGFTDFCKTYTTPSWEQGASTAVEIGINDNTSNQVFDLADAWTRN